MARPSHAIASGEARRRRHGRRLRGGRTSLGRDVALKFLPAERRATRPHSSAWARGARGGRAQPSEHLHHPRNRRARRRAVHRDGAARGPDAEAPDRRQAAADRASCSTGGPDRRRARRRARARHHPPRHQAGEHLRHRARPGQGARLRAGEATSSAGPGARRLHETAADSGHGHRPHEPGHDARHGRLHVARAGAGREARRAQRPVLLRRRALRDGDGPAGVRRAARRPSTFDAILHGTPRRAPINPALAGRARPHHRQGARKGPPPALPDRRRFPGGLAAEAGQRLRAHDRPAGRRARARRGGKGQIARGAVLREPQRRERRRVLPRRDDGRHHHGALEDQAPPRVPAAEMLAYRDKPTAPRRSARNSHAAYVLGGSLRRAGNRLRITAQLVETRTRHSVWTERYDREMADVFEVQDEIARKIAQALRITLSPQEEAHIAQKPTEDLQAYDYFLRGRNYLRLENFEFACRCSSRPSSATRTSRWPTPASANVCGLIYELREKSPKWIERGLASCERAMALETRPRRGALGPRAHVLRAAEIRGRRGLRAARDRAQAGLRGRLQHPRPRAISRPTASRKPRSSSSRRSKPTATTTTPTFRTSCASSGWAARPRKLKVRERQIRTLERQLELVPDDVRARILLPAGYARRAGRRRHDAVQRAVHLRPNDGNTLYNATCVYGILGRKAEALRHVPESRRGRLRQQGVGGSRHGSRACLHDDARVPIAGGTPRDDVAGQSGHGTCQC